MRTFTEAPSSGVSLPHRRLQLDPANRMQEAALRTKRAPAPIRRARQGGKGRPGRRGGRDAGTTDGMETASRPRAAPPTCGGGTALTSDVSINVSSLQQHITGFGVS